MAKKPVSKGRKDHRAMDGKVSFSEGEEALVGSCCQEKPVEGIAMVGRQPGGQVPLCTGVCWALKLQAFGRMLCYHLTKVKCEHLALSPSTMTLSCSCI